MTHLHRSPGRLPARRWLALLAAAPVLLGAAALRAQDDDGHPWNLSLSLPWRQGLQVSFAPIGPNQYLDGSVRDVGSGLYEYRVRDPLRQVSGAYLDQIDFADPTVDRARENLDSAPGLQLDLRRALLSGRAWRLGLAGSLRTFIQDGDLARQGTVTTVTYGVYPNGWPSPNPPGGGPDPTVHRAYFPANDLIGRSGASPITVRYDLDLYLGELSAGGFASWRCGRFEASAEAAPVLALVHLDTERRIAADPAGAWPAFRQSDTVTTAIPGFRLGANLRWHVRSPFFLELGADYEWFTRPVEGDFSRVDLDAFALRTGAGCRF